MTPDTTTVLVGTALTPDSEPVVQAGAAVARALGAKVHLAHAVPYPVEFFDDTLLSDRVLEAIRTREIETLVREATAQAERVGLGDDLLHGITVEPGEPHRTLVELARTLHPELVVIGAAEESGRITRAFGSTAGRVIRKATRPVLVVRHGCALPPASVLLPVDLSPLSADVSRSACALLGRLGAPASVRTEVLFVLTERQRLLLTAAEVAGDPVEATRQRLAVFCERYLSDLPGTVEPRLRGGEPADEIVKRAQELRPDLVVVGTHGRSGFERLLIGSVAADVVRGVPSSVLVVPPEAALRAAIAQLG